MHKNGLLNMKHKFILLLMPVYMLACQGNNEVPVGNTDVTAVLLEQSYECQLTDSKASIKWIVNDRELLRFYRGFVRNIVPRPEIKLPPINFNTDKVLAVFMGQQATAGFSLGLGEKNIYFTNTRPLLEIDWNQPGKDMMVAQVITNPCIVVSVPKSVYPDLEVRFNKSAR